MKTTNITKKKILVIDDNSGILFVMRQALELKDYEVHTSETFSGVLAVEKIAPDLIYLDISLVGQDGRQIAKVLKNNKTTKNIPIIILTAYPNAGELTKEAGADDYLPKPFELEHLWEMTANYTGK
ncbi:MAG: response regulator [bacterium]|nr:response regulator [bacterium]